MMTKRVCYIALYLLSIERPKETTVLTPPFGLFMYCFRDKPTYALLGCKRTRRQQRFAVQTGLLLGHQLHGMFWPLRFGLTP